MIKRVHFDECDSFDEVCTQINKLIDIMNKNAEYNAEVEKYNESINDEP